MTNIMKAAFITTVFNDEKGIRMLLDSLLKQTVLPSEIVIVDAKSKDKTVAVARTYGSMFPRGTLKIIVQKGNRSEGRNLAIKQCRSKIVAVSDAGCILDKEWFERITSHLIGGENDVVAGYYKPGSKSIFQKSLATYTCVMPDRVTKDFLPSSRSIAFRKDAWEDVGGYPEELDTCEDLVFAKNLKNRGFRFFVEKKAIVVWPQKENLKDAFVQFFGYAKGDGFAHYFRKSTPLLFLRFFCLILLVLLPIEIVLKASLLLFLFSLYIYWSVYKNYRYVKNFRAIFYLPLLQVVSDVAVFSGMNLGILRSFLK